MLATEPKVEQGALYLQAWQTQSGQTVLEESQIEPYPLPEQVYVSLAQVGKETLPGALRTSSAPGSPRPTIVTS
jgi:hypothetical protein